MSTLKHNGVIDWRCLIKAMQAFPEGFSPALPIGEMIRIMSESVDASRGVLLLAEQDALIVKAESRINTDTDVQTLSISLPDFNGLPAELVRYVFRGKKPVLISDTQKPQIFENSSYFSEKPAKSVMAVPMICQGEAAGVVYMENNAGADGFTQDHLQALELLAAQAMISIRNAQLCSRIAISEEKYRSIFENAVEGLFQISGDGRIISANRSMARLLGYTSPEELMDSVPRIIDQFFADNAIRKRFIQTLEENGQVIEFESLGLRRDGEKFPASISVRNVRNAKGEIVCYEGSIVDITGRAKIRKAETEREAAKAATRSKSKFLANMSHEIRTPMNAIVGLAELTLRTELKEKQRDYLTKIRDSASSLIKVIDDVLDFSKIEAGKLKLESTEFSFSEIAEKIAVMFASTMVEKGVELIFSISGEIPEILIGDPLRLGQVLINLISNAFKFTHEGQIILYAEPVERKNGKVRLRFAVTDSGIGIAEEYLPRLFESFTQADGSTTRRYGGTGLGLAISKNIVELMNGCLWADSKVGRGSTFSFEVELGCRPDANKRLPDLPDGYKAMRVLVVDDNRFSRAMLTTQLRNLGLEAYSCASGAEALALLKRAALLNEEYDMIFMDWKMPDMNGIESARRVREELEGTKSPFIILVTAFGQDEAKIQTRHPGINAFLVKPIQTERLYRSILDVVQSAPGATVENLQAYSPPQKKKALTDIRLLLVDDNAINRQVAMELLEDIGFTVDVAHNGDEAIFSVELRTYNAVLMDVQMPVMDGFETTRIIRRNARHQELPIIAMTAHATDEYRGKSLNVGMTDYITKPLEMEQLLTTLAKHMPSAADRIMGSMAASTESLSTGDLPEEISGIDIAAGLKRLGGNQRLYLKMTSAFYKDYSDIGRILADVFEKKDYDFIRRTAHTVKGLAESIGAMDLKRVSHRLQMAAAEDDPKAVGVVLDDFIAVFESVLPSLEQIEKWATAEQTNRKDRQSRQASKPKPIEPVLSELNRRLADGRSSAIEYFKANRSLFGTPELLTYRQQMEKQIENYDFEDARKVLTKIAEILDSPMKSDEE